MWTNIENAWRTAKNVCGKSVICCYLIKGGFSLLLSPSWWPLGALTITNWRLRWAWLVSRGMESTTLCSASSSSEDTRSSSSPSEERPSLNI